VATKCAAHRSPSLGELSWSYSRKTLSPRNKSPFIIVKLSTTKQLLIDANTATGDDYQAAIGAGLPRQPPAPPGVRLHTLYFAIEGG
jgi:hypothetical protein